jgi:hypothetical protein
MSHGHQERPTGSKLEVKLRSVPIDYRGPARRQLSQIRHGTEVGDSSPKNLCGRLAHRFHRLVVLLTQGSQRARLKREFHARLEGSSGEAALSALVDRNGMNCLA